MKKTITLRYLTYWLYVIITLCVPIGLLAWQFNLFKKPGVLQLTGYGIIALIIAVFILKGHIKRAIEDMDKCILRTVLQNILRIAPYIFFWFVLTFLEDHIIKVRFIIFWSIVSNTVATFFDIWHTTLVEKCQKE